MSNPQAWADDDDRAALARGIVTGAVVVVPAAEWAEVLGFVRALAPILARFQSTGSASKALQALMARRGGNRA